MKQFKLAASIVSALLLSSSAFAHISFKGEVMPANAPYNWTGYYGGLNVGIVNHTMNITDTQAVSFNGTIQQVSNPRFTGGFQLGYRLQLDPSRISGVYGLEFSTNFSNARFKKEYGSPFALYQLSSEHALQTVCLLQLMGGIAAERTLLFLTAGMSWANITGHVNNLDSIAFFNSFSVQKNELGTAVGGGIEYAITDTISARIKVDVITPHTYSTSDNNGNSYLISNNIVQGTFGLNYTFA
jgi:outer membrane immunogenic protein